MGPKLLIARMEGDAVDPHEGDRRLNHAAFEHGVTSTYAKRAANHALHDAWECIEDAYTQDRHDDGWRRWVGLLGEVQSKLRPDDPKDAVVFGAAWAYLIKEAVLSGDPLPAEFMPGVLSGPASSVGSWLKDLMTFADRVEDMCSTKACVRRAREGEPWHRLSRLHDTVGQAK
jgi:hypothetical protein